MLQQAIANFVAHRLEQAKVLALVGLQKQKMVQEAKHRALGHASALVMAR
jgi:hypothetical protein